jgi:uncharacterized repeat protein (TIGR01451 family)
LCRKLVSLTVSLILLAFVRIGVTLLPKGSEASSASWLPGVDRPIYQHRTPELTHARMVAFSSILPTGEDNSDLEVIGRASSAWAVAEDNWPQVQKDASHSGYVSQTIGPPYREIWRRGTPPISTRVQPIIAEGLIFLPSNDQSLYALSTADGQTAWSYLTEGALVNSAAYDNGKVFFGSTDHFIYAVNADSHLAWRYETGDTVRTAPVVAEGKVFVGSSDGYMYALNQENGELAWRYYIGAPIYDTAAYDSGKVFFGGMDSVGYALDGGTGELVWSLPIPGQGFRDRWTVAGNGYVFFTPMLYGSHHTPLDEGTFMFHEDADPSLYNQPWSVQRQVISDYLAERPYYQPLFVIDQESGQEVFVPPILFAAGGSQSPHSQPVLLPNGNVNVIYRRSFGEPAHWGATTNDALFTGELDLATGDIIPVDHCQPGTGGWADCGDYKGPYISDESSALVRSGDILYLDTARGTLGLDIANEVMLPTVACYNTTSGGPFYIDNCLVAFDDYASSPTGWRVHYDNLESEVSSDGNDTKRPTPIVGDTLYVFHYNTLVAVEGTKVGTAPPRRVNGNHVHDQYSPQMASTVLQTYNIWRELESRVAEMVSLGHMAPTLYFNGLGGGGTNLGGAAIFYMTPGETIYTLSAAYPHLSPPLQVQVKAYIDDELQTYPPHTQGSYPPSAGTVSDLVGAHREYFMPNLYQSFDFWPGVPVHVSVLYSLWLYSYNTGDWSYVMDNYDVLASIYADFRSGGGITSYPELSGVIGFARIAQHLGHTGDYEDAASCAQDGFMNAADFDRFLAIARSGYPAGNHAYTTPVFMFNRNPVALHFDRDIGMFLLGHAASAVGAYVEDISRDVPLWWLTGVALSHGENAYATPEVSWTGFMLEAYVLDVPIEQLRHHLDAPDRRGDLLYIQKLVAMIEALGPPDLSPSTKAVSDVIPRLGEKVTYTVTIHNGGARFIGTVYLTDTVPSGLNYIPGTLTATLGIPDDSQSPTLQWSGVLSSTSSAVVTYAVTVSLAGRTAQVQQISNVAVISAEPIGAITRTATIIANGWHTYLPVTLKDWD